MSELLLDIIFNCYANSICSIIGFLLSIVCFFTFNNSIFKLNYYNYFKMEISLIGFDLFLTIFSICNYCPLLSLKSTYALVAYKFYGLWYFKSVLELSANLCCIFGTLNFYCIIAKKNLTWLKIISNISYIKVCSCLFIFSCAFFSYRLFEINIISVFDNKTNQSDHYVMSKTKFAESKIYGWLTLLTYSFRDLITTLILLILNLLIFINVKKAISNKKYLQNRNLDSNEQRNIKSTENSLKLMVFFGNFNNILGRLPLLIYFYNSYLIKFESAWLLDISILIIYLSYIIKFMLYFFTNKLFKKILQNYLNSVIIFLGLKNDM